MPKIPLSHAWRGLSNTVRERHKATAALCGASALSLVLVGVTVVPASAAPSDTFVSDRELVSESFDRTSVDGWGSAPLGGEYTYAAPKSFSADGAAGTVALPDPGTSRTAILGSVSALDARASESISLPALPSRGSGVSSGLQLRVQDGSYYQANVRVDSAGETRLSIVRINGSTSNQTVLAAEKTVIDSATPGDTINLEFQVTGTSAVNLDARAWLDGSTTPEWQATAEDSDSDRLSDAGAVALWSYVSRSTPGLSITVDDLSAVSLKPEGSAPVVPPVTPAPPVSPAPPVEPAPPAEPAPPVTAPAEPVDAGHGIDTSGSRNKSGAAPIGSARYEVPSGAVFVSPTGSDNGSGSTASPYRSVQNAIDKARSGSTLVLRAGTYHETVKIPDDKRLTIQPYPGEAVWFDGSSKVDGWQKSGATWVSGPWNHQFDSSPTYTFGAEDGNTPSWTFVNQKFPMAAHPDQLWIDGVAQAQVRSQGEVKAGTFFVDYAGKRLYLGTDPSGKSVRASDRDKAISIRGEGSTLRGFGVRNYAPSVPHMGAVTAEKNGITIENVAILNSSTTALHVSASNAEIRDVTIARSGMLGMSASTADGLRVSGLLSADNNVEHFNQSPVSGGFKITRSRNVHVVDSAFLNNDGPGLWFDESVYDGRVLGNDSLNNAGHGLSIEISSKFVVVDNLIANSGGNGMKINDASGVDIWNNTVSNGNRNINIVQDNRRASNLSTPGHDPRQKLPDPSVTWLTGPVNVHNNVIAGTTGNCMVCVEDYSHARSGEQMKVKLDGNVYQRASESSPRWFAVWSRGAGDPSVHDTLEQFQAATGQEGSSLGLTGSAVFADGWSLAENVASMQPAIALPLPGTLASLVGESTGERSLGAWH